MRRLVLFAALVISAACAAFPSDYSEKIYIWRGVGGMETQLRDSILYVCGAEPGGSRPAVIVCPGGSYHHLGMPHEGFATARWFVSRGFTAFVLRYRVAYNEHHHPDQLEDIQRSLQIVREGAERFGIDAGKVGAIGFSAGGHLVTMAGEFGGRVDELEKLGIRTDVSLRPDFVMPIYPVVSMQDDIAHRWSRTSLLGHRYSAPDAAEGFSLFNLRGFKYSQSLKDRFSMELPSNIPDDMPPVFLLACGDDPVVMYENSVRLDRSLTERGVPHVFVSYPTGGHGFGMDESSEIMRRTRWNDRRLLPWLREIGVIGNVVPDDAHIKERK